MALFAHKVTIFIVIFCVLVGAEQPTNIEDKSRVSLICQARCLADCTDNRLKDYCVDGCKLFKNNDWIEECKDPVCFDTCNYQNDKTGSRPSAPILEETENNIAVHDSLVTLKWTSESTSNQSNTVVYLVEKRKIDSKIWQIVAKTWDRNYTINESKLNEEQGCTVFTYRVAAVNKYGISPYSREYYNAKGEQWPPPGLVEHLKFQKEPYFDPVTKYFIAVIVWKPPQGWTGWTQSSQLPTYNKTCHAHNMLPASPIFSVENNYELRVRVHESAFGCQFNIRVRLYSVCAVAGAEETILLDLSDCDQLANYVCPSKKPREPGHVRAITVTTSAADDDNEEEENYERVRVTWLPPNDLGTFHSITRYAVQWGTLDMTSPIPMLVPENTTSVPGIFTEVSFLTKRTNTDFGVQIVAVGNESQAVSWGLYPVTAFKLTGPSRSVKQLKEYEQFKHMFMLNGSLLNNTSKYDRASKVMDGNNGDRQFHMHLSTNILWYTAIPAVILALLLAVLFYMAKRGRKFLYLEHQPTPIAEAFNLYNQVGVHDNRAGESRSVSTHDTADHWEIAYSMIMFKHELGEGAFGHVYFATLSADYKRSRDVIQTRGNGEIAVAVKRLHNFADKQEKQEFKREIELMKTMGVHVNVVGMLACCTTSDPLCLIVEHMPNGDLLRYLRKHRYNMNNPQNNVDSSEEYYEVQVKLTYRDLLNFARQIARGMEFLSQRGFVHRDLACRNVLVGENHTVKVGDFGLTRYVCNDRVYVNRKGGKLPLKWMSLEAIFDLTFSTYSDVWSFGIVLFEIATLGGTPYPTLHSKEFLHLLKAGYRMEKPDSCDRQLYDIMLQCWQEVPIERPHFGDLCLALDSILQRYAGTEYLEVLFDIKQMYYNAPVSDNDVDIDGDVSEIVGHGRDVFDDVEEWTDAIAMDSPVWLRNDSYKQRASGTDCVSPWSGRDHYSVARSSGSSGRDSIGTKLASDDAFDEEPSHSQKPCPHIQRRHDSGNVSYEMELNSSSANDDMCTLKTDTENRADENQMWFDITV